jgi:hypothetical protein
MPELLLVSMLILQALSTPALVGLWDFEGLAAEADRAVTPVAVHLDPSASSPVVARLDKEGILLAPRQGSGQADGSKRSCTWKRDRDRPASPRGCLFTESGYEIPSLAVFARQATWLRIALDDNATRFGWVQQRGDFHALADLVAAERLTYLTGAWDKRLHDSPAADLRTGRDARVSTNAARATEVPYRTIAQRIVQGRLWLHVELLDQVCSGGEPNVIDTGWVPAQSPAGDQWAWFWSRGC